MNKEDILRSSRQENNREYIQFLDFKTVPIIMACFIFLCIGMMLFSCFAVYQKDILYTTATLLFTFLTIYCLAYFYYLRRYTYLVMSITFAILLVKSLISLWLLIW